MIYFQDLFNFFFYIIRVERKAQKHETHKESKCFQLGFDDSRLINHGKKAFTNQ